MKTKKEQILDSFNLVLNQKIERVLLVPPLEEKVFLHGGISNIHGIPRLLASLKGNQVVTYYKNGKIQNQKFSEKTWYYCTANGYLYHDGKKNCPTENISISYYGKHIRVMHIFYDGIHRPPTQNDVFYHVNHAICSAGKKVIATLDELTLDSDYTEAAIYLMKALLQITIEEIEKSVEFSEKNNTKNSASSLWVMISTYIREHCSDNINRETVAQHFKLSPGYISHLFHIFSNTNFSNTLQMFRFDYATKLLRESQLTIDEICFESGFNYSSYFIRRFKKNYNMTPLSYRKKIRKKEI